jgi:putative transposase
MARKRYKPEEIVAKLRQVDVLVSQGQNMVDAIRQIGVSEVTYYRWRQEFGGLKTEQVKHLKDLELENKFHPPWDSHRLFDDVQLCPKPVGNSSCCWADASRELGPTRSPRPPCPRNLRRTDICPRAIVSSRQRRASPQVRPSACGWNGWRAVFCPTDMHTARRESKLGSTRTSPM